MIIAKRSLVFSVLLLGILGVGEVASTKKGKGRRFQQRPLVSAYHSAAFRVPQQQIPLYQPLLSSYPTPPALRQSPVRLVAPRPGIVVFGVGPHSLQIPNHYTNYGGAAQQTNRNVPRPAHYAPSATVIPKTATRIQPPVQTYTQRAPHQQNSEQTRFASQPIQPVYPVQSSQYGNKLPVAQPEKYQQPIVPSAAAPAPVTFKKLPESIPTYVAPAKSTVYASAYVTHGASYPASPSYTREEASKPVGSVPSPYQSPAKQPQESYQNTPTILYGSKTTESYKETMAEQSTQAYTKRTTQVKENQSYYSTPSPKVKYFTDVPYSAPEYKPTSVFHGTPFHAEKPNADKHQSKIPVYLASQSYKEAESLSYDEKKEVDSSALAYSKVEANPASQSSKQNTYTGKTQEETKVETSVYPASQSYKKIESEMEKKNHVPVYVSNTPHSNSDSVNVGENNQQNPQPEKLSANQYKQQTSVYPTTQSYKEVHSQTYSEEKKNVDASSYHYSEVEAKPVTESSNKNAYQIITEEKKEVAFYPASQDYEEVESSKDIPDYKKQSAAVYGTASGSDSYGKNSYVQPYVKDSQPKQPQENYKTTPSTLYSSKTAENYKETKAEHSTETYVKETTQLKENQSYYSTTHPEVQYSADVPYSGSEYKPTISVSYDTPSHTETQNLDKHQLKNPVYPASQSYQEAESFSYDWKKDGDSSVFAYSNEVKPASQSSKQNAYKGSIQEESKVNTPVFPASQSHKKVESQEEEKKEVSVYVSNHHVSKSEPINLAESYQANPQAEKSSSKQYKHQTSVYPTTQSYEKVDSLSYGEQNKEVDHSSLPYSNPAGQPSKHHDEYEGLVQEEPKVKGLIYPESHSYKKEESSEEEKKQVPVYIPNRIPAKSELTTVSESNQSNLQQDKSYAEKDEQQASIYVTTQSYKEVDTHSYGGVKAKPVTESSKQNAYQLLPEGKKEVGAYLASQGYKEADKRQHYNPEAVPYKAAIVLSNQKYASISPVTQESSKFYGTSPETYKSSNPFVSPVLKSPGKELNSYSKPTSVESSSYSFPVYSTTTSFPSYQYSPGSTTTTKISRIPIEVASKVYNKTTPPPYSPKDQQSTASESPVNPYHPTYKITVADILQPEKYQQPIVPSTAAPAPVTFKKLPESIPTYVAPAKSTVYASAYVAHGASYPTSPSYTREEASKPVGSVPSPYQSPAKQPQESYQNTPTTLYSTKTTENYKETMAEQSTQAYTKQTTQVKENQSYYPTPSPKVKYFTDVPYSAPEYKPTSVSYGTPSHAEKPNADKHQSKIPVYPASQSYKEAESLSYDEKKEVDSSPLAYSKVEANPVSQSSKQNTYTESTQEKTNVKASVYPASQSYKKIESEMEKKNHVPVYVSNPPPSKSKPISVGEFYQTNPQPEKLSANQYKQQTPVYPTTQSYKEVDSQSYSEEKKNIDASRYPYSEVKVKPVTESSKENLYQLLTEGKKEVALYPASQDYKEVDLSKDFPDYKKQNAAIYETTSVGDSYVKNLDVQSYAKESQPNVVPISDSYGKVESLSNSEYKGQHNNLKPVPYKATTVLAKYPSILAVTQESSKYYETNSESNYPSVSPVLKSPVKELNSYSKPTSVESNGYTLPVYSTTISSPSYQYSTGYKTTTERSTTPAQENSKEYYKTTPKYQEYSSSPSVTVQDHQEYKSTSTINYVPVATTPSPKQDDYNQYSTKKYVNMKVDASVAVETSYASQTTTTNYNVKANDRVYVVADQDDIVESYNKNEPSVAYPSYKNPSADEKLSTIKEDQNQYAPTDRDYSSAPIGTANKSNYNSRPAALSAADLSTYNGKPVTGSDTFTTSADITKPSDVYPNDSVAGDYSAIPGKPEVDYPIFSELPNDKFNCSEQRLPGYYADTSARCQVFHICLGDRQWSFLCPNGTIFSQQHFVCVWWYEFDCSKATSLYDLNEKLFIIPSKQQDPDQKGDQYAKAPTSETLEETGKQYETFRNKGETTSGAY